jgi:hypothetical protein
MASTYTNTGLELIATGEQSGTWGTTTNENWELIEEAVDGVISIALTATTKTLTTSDGLSSEGRHKAIKFTGTPGGTCTVTISPNDMQKLYFIKNASDQTVTLTQGSGGNVSIVAGAIKYVYCDGAGANAQVVDLTSGLELSGIVDASTFKIDGTEVTASAAELNYVDGVTSNVQTQLDSANANSLAFAIALG